MLAVRRGAAGSERFVTPTCACGRPVKDQATLCQGCTDRLARDLGEIGALAEELTTTRLRQSRTGGQATGVLSRSYERPLPWDERASEAQDVLRSTVVAWVRVVLEERGGRMPDDDMGRMGAFLLGSLEWLRHHQAADEVADEIGHAVQHARRMIDLAPEKVYAGPCREEFVTGEPEQDWPDDEGHLLNTACCVAELYARQGADAITCRNCGAEHSVAERHRWLVAIANDQLVTASVLSKFLSAYGEPLTADRIWKWAERGQLVAHGKDKAGRPTYRVSEAVELLAQMPMTRRKAG